MALKLGSNAVDSVYLGGTAVDAVYRGSTLIWSKRKKYTVHFRQLVDNSRFTTSSSTVGGFKYTHNSDNSITVLGTSTAANCFRNINYTANANNSSIYDGHTYLSYISYVSIGTTQDHTPQLRTYYTNANGESAIIYDDTIVTVNRSATTATSWTRTQPANASGQTVDSTLYAMLFDLTEMFADCPEITPTTVDEFKAMFPEQYYAYTADAYDVTIEV